MIEKIQQGGNKTQIAKGTRTMDPTIMVLSSLVTLKQQRSTYECWEQELGPPKNASEFGLAQLFLFL